MLKIYTPDEAKNSILKRDDIFFSDEIISAEATTRTILNDIRKDGDKSVEKYSLQFDGAKPTVYEKEQLTAALTRIPADLRTALEKAAGRIRQFHALQPLPNWTTTDMGGTLGQRVTPIQKVGVYVPGGTAPLPSSVLMGAIPAQVAGVPHITLVTPPKPGGVSDAILAAAKIIGLETVTAIGGVQAIAALTFGTESIARVDKIVGPGNLYVTLAKRLVYGIVGIDGLYGPTETMVIADESANPEWVAADLLAQAEHDVLASAILLTDSQALAQAVLAETEAQFDGRQRKNILMQSLSNKSGIILVQDLAQAVQISDAYAPEHLCIAVADPQSISPSPQNAGGIFYGEHSFEVLGDYVAGPSHTMPTSGTARFASPLNVSDFIKINSIIALDEKTGRELSHTAEVIGSAESLDAHAYSAKLRQ